MRKSAPLSLILIAACSAFAACTSPAVLTGCAGTAAWGLAVTVHDTLTDVPVAAGATLLTYDLAVGGSRVDSTTGTSDTAVLRGADDRAGRYTVVVRKTGYGDWIKTDVVVHNGCPHIETVTLTARLAQP